MSVVSRMLTWPYRPIQLLNVQFSRFDMLTLSWGDHSRTGANRTLAQKSVHSQLFLHSDPLFAKQAVCPRSGMVSRDRGQHIQTCFLYAKRFVKETRLIFCTLS